MPIDMRIILLKAERPDANWLAKQILTNGYFDSTHYLFKEWCAKYDINLDREQLHDISHVWSTSFVQWLMLSILDPL